ncbi:hypothetical protein ACFYWU_37645 [Streptomyces chrestomyceticus]|uniref:hypothetical protein n=1 Tax=Streptomyces chrestomyceticus TaxID=68185 RepID=UPI0036C712E6
MADMYGLTKLYTDWSSSTPNSARAAHRRTFEPVRDVFRYEDTYGRPREVETPPVTGRDEEWSVTVPREAPAVHGRGPMT